MGSPSLRLRMRIKSQKSHPAGMALSFFAGGSAEITSSYRFCSFNNLGEKNLITVVRLFYWLASFI
jgi:hypothetical protein